MDDPRYTAKSSGTTACRASLSLLSLFLLLALLSISSCAQGPASNTSDAFGVKPAGHATSSQESPAVTPQKPAGPAPKQPAVTLEQDTGQTRLTIPVDAATRISPDYAHPHFQLDFFPAVPQCSTPEIDDHPLLQTLQPKPAADSEGKWESLHLTVKHEIRYLISRSSPNRMTLLMEPAVSDDESTNAVSPASGADNVVPLLEDISFSKDRDNNQLIRLKTTVPGHYELLLSAGTTIKLLLPRIKIPAEFVKRYNLQKFATAVKSAQLQNSPQGGILELRTWKRRPIHIERTGNGLSLRIAEGPPDTAQNSESKHAGQDPQAPRTGQAFKQTPNQDTSAAVTPVASETTKYTGQPISIDLQDAQVEHILRLIEAVAGYSFVVGQDVSGRMTLSLHNVPWDQALDIVLKELNLKKEIQQGNILRIMSYAKYNQEQEQEIKEAQQRAQKILAQRDKQESQEESAPLMTRYIQVNYTTASQLEPQLQSFLTDRGKLSSDARTNQLIVHDTAASIKTVENVVKRLDRPERQVLIEARLVYITDEFQRSMGINWGGSVTNSGGTSTGSGDLAVNLPSAGAATLDVGGLIEKVSGSDLFTLDAQLQLGESQNQVQTISSPRVLTLNNFRAQMSQGTKIATQAESESGGTTTEYVEAVLDLSVLPQITPDNKIILDLEISDDSPTGAGDDIETRSASTKLIVDDEETVVIGGVQQLQETGGSDRVPGVSNIPLLGWLFQNKDLQKTKRELLIFIHPKIIE